jgi:K+/H+ antiporter YhaU regulatory subunit KhtT
MGGLYLLLPIPKATEIIKEGDKLVVYGSL